MQAKKKKPPEGQALGISKQLMHLVLLKKISLYHAAVYETIAAFSSSKIGCVLKNGTIAERLGVSKRSATNYVTELKDWGFIKQVFFNGRVRRLKTIEDIALEEVVENVFGVKVAKFARQPRKNCAALLRSSNGSYRHTRKAGCAAGGNGFLESENTKPPPEEVFAKRLGQFVLRLTKHLDWQIRPQAKFVSKLFRRVGEPRATKVLKWYTSLEVSSVNQLTQEYKVKAALTCEMFLQHFDLIEAAMHRLQGDSKEAYDDVEVRNVGTRIMD